jgi:hypothetical protein
VSLWRTNQWKPSPITGDNNITVTYQATPPVSLRFALKNTVLADTLKANSGQLTLVSLTYNGETPVMHSMRTTFTGTTSKSLNYPDATMSTLSVVAGVDGAIRDTLTYAISFRKPTVADSCFVWRVKKSGLTIIAGEAKRESGTSATVNIKKNGVDMFTNYASTAAFASMGSVSNGTLTIGDSIMATVRAVAGTPNAVFIQLTYVKVLR